MKNLAIRKATLNDLEAITLLSDKLGSSGEVYDKCIVSTWAHTTPGKKYFVNAIQKTDGICLVATSNTKVIGYCSGTLPKKESWRTVKLAEIDNIFVEEEFRQKGIGKLLLDEFCNWAKKMKIDRVSISAFAENTRAIALYKREGFAPYDLILEKKL